MGLNGILKLGARAAPLDDRVRLNVSRISHMATTVNSGRDRRITVAERERSCGRCQLPACPSRQAAPSI
jgi:hypothetical protein